MRVLADIRAGWSSYAPLCAQAAARAPAVSAWSVGEHIDHVARAHAGILRFFAEPAPEPDATRGITLLGRFVLLTGRIPRGRGKAPAATLPATPDADALRTAVTAVAQRLDALAADPTPCRDRSRRWMHPVFGGLHRAQWLGFLRIHQAHHAAIIRDILAAGVSR